MTPPRTAPKPGTALRRNEARVLRALDPEQRTVRFIFSDGSVDRMGDTIDPNGWSTTAFMKNPVILWSHDSAAPPIGRALRVWSDGTRLMGDIAFAPSETYAFADTIYRLVLGKYLSAGSVGFRGIDYKWADDPARPSGVDFKKQELLEFSLVTIPANANALVQAQVKGLLSMRDFRRIHGQDGVDDDDGQAEALRARAKLRRLRLARLPSAAPASHDHDDDLMAAQLAHIQREHDRIVDARRVADVVAHMLHW